MKKYLWIIAAAATSLFAMQSCMKDHDNDYKKYEQMCQENLDKGKEFWEENGKRDGVTQTQSGLQYEIINEGNKDGKQPKASSQVSCHYKGSLIDGTIFDSSYERGEPIEIYLNKVIAGWTEGLQLMKEGAKYRFVIPYYMAYGSSATQSIPPYSTLIFEVELLKVM